MINNQFTSKITITSSIFSGGRCRVKIDSYFDGIEGDGNSDNVSDAFKASLGEQMERISLYNTATNEEGSIIGYDIVRQREKVFPLNFMLLNKGSIGSEFKRIDEGFDMFDSSGAAFGVNGNMATYSAAMEFVERQSLVYSFNAEFPGQKINDQILLKAGISADKLGKLYGSFDEVIINDISIVSGIYVVIIVATSDDFFAVGLAAADNIGEAFNHAFFEGLGLGKGFPIIVDNKHLEKISGSKRYLEEFRLQSKNDIEKAYGYLKNGENFKVVNSQGYLDALISFGKRIEIPIFICFLPSRLIGRNTVGKVARVFSPSGYPSIDNETFDPNDFKISAWDGKNTKFVKVKQYLPFP